MGAMILLGPLCSWSWGRLPPGLTITNLPRFGPGPDAITNPSAVMARPVQGCPMAAVIYLALVGGGLTAAVLLTVVLRGIRLI